MHTPSTKCKRQLLRPTPLTSTSPRQTPARRTHSSLTQQLETNPHLADYLRFKMNLLQAMVTLDPLAILESDIFEEYEMTLTSNLPHHSKASPCHLTISHFQDQLSQFQTKWSSYEVSEGVRVTQLQRRSRSCDRASAQERAIRRLEAERNTQFVLFASILRSLGHSNTPKPQEADFNLQTSIVQPSASFSNQLALANCSVLQNLKVELSQILKQNKDLATELSQCQSKLEQQQVINTSATNDRNDKELEFLLKEKQLNRKLQEARQEIEALRALLEDTPRNTPVHERQTPNEPDQTDGMASLKEKVALEGRIRWALSHAWGAQLEADCR